MESALVRYNGDLLSSQQSEPQQLNAHPSSDQLKAWSDILSGALSESSSVFPLLLSCSSRFLRALQQNRAQSGLLYLLNISLFTSLESNFQCKEIPRSFKM